jgi:Uma2 family endonuclease
VALSRNDYEPDICYFRPAKAALIHRDQMTFPAPDMVVEVLSPSTEKTDRTIKLDDYAAHGVAEYWIIDPDTETVEQYVLKDEHYELVIKARTGAISSAAVQGFDIPIRAIFDLTENQAALRTIMAGN